MSTMKKSIVSLVVLGMTLSGAVGVYAGTNMQKITASLNHSIEFIVNGATYKPTDPKGKPLVPITYQNTTYLPVRAIADALNVPVEYNSKSGQVMIGTSPSTSEVEVSEVEYSATHIKEIKKAYANFESFETAYVPKQMTKGDAYKRVSAAGDGVVLLFNHMTVNVSPRDYSYLYDSKSVKLANGIEAKWYTPDDTPMLSFKLDDRFVTISSQDHSLNQAQIEKVAVSVAKLK